MSISGSRKASWRCGDRWVSEVGWDNGYRRHMFSLDVRLEGEKGKEGKGGYGRLGSQRAGEREKQLRGRR